MGQETRIQLTMALQLEIQPNSHKDYTMGKIASYLAKEIMEANAADTIKSVELSQAHLTITLTYFSRHSGRTVNIKISVYN